MPSASIASSVARTPAVSTSVTGTPPSTTRASSASSVVPGVAQAIRVSIGPGVTKDDVQRFGRAWTAAYAKALARAA